MPAVAALAAAAALFAVLLPRGPEPSDERPATPPAPRGRREERVDLAQPSPG